MKRLYALLLLGLVSLDASALGRLADVAVVDRDTGRTLETYYYRGEYWVAGTPGNRYAISIHNRLRERVLAVTAVDGVNVVSGETAAYGQSGYVLSPWQSYSITGWRKSNSDVAAFEFTAAPNSYAERTGRALNVGVIGIALFRERLPEPEPLAQNAPPASLARAEDASAARESAKSASPSAQDRLASGAAVMQRAPEPKLGTGHGEREASYVEHTEFSRLSGQPNEIIRIRYDSRDNLVAMGVLPRRLPRPFSPNAFPESPNAGFVPDPPGYPSAGLR